MFDIWGFLLQTLTVSGVAVLLLIIKSLFKDKLPPKWHFSVWSILGIIILFPAGILHRYALFNWQTIIEFFKILMKDYSFTRVLLPFPIIREIPNTLAEWIFFIYTAGVIISLLIYLISYIKLRVVLRKSNVPNEETIAVIRDIAEKHNIKPCKIVEIPGLPSAFVCGIIRPVLVVPEKTPDEKVILHELFHLKNKDTLWSVVICILRCLHWCNPLISYCANLAINDMESRCDQFVLEQLEGEERRCYGEILLSMSNEQFAKTPGSTCINNGGKNIRKRIEAIVRFKKYPVGMSLVSICIIVALGCSLIIGVQATDVPINRKINYWTLASAKSSHCTTYAGAFDTYAKAVIQENRSYRIVCAPEDMQPELFESTDYHWDSGLNGKHDSSHNYYIFNLKMPKENVYEGLLVLKLVNVPDGFEFVEDKHYLAHQNVRAFKENGRWVVTPLNDFEYILSDTNFGFLGYGDRNLPGITYTDTIDDYKVDIVFQTIYLVDNKIKNQDALSSMMGNSYSYSTIPVLNAKFNKAYDNNEITMTHLGTQEERDLVKKIGFSMAPIYPGQEEFAELTPPIGNLDIYSSSSDGTCFSVLTQEPGWGPETHFSSGGGSRTLSQLLRLEVPEYYVADLYINNELYGQLELHFEEESK